SGSSSAFGRATSWSCTTRSPTRSRSCSMSGNERSAEASRSFRLPSFRLPQVRAAPKRRLARRRVAERSVIIATVGSHARESWTRSAASALALAMLASPARAQTLSAFVDLAPDLSSKIAAELAPAVSIRLSFAADQERVRAEVARLLAERGFRAADGGDAAIV